MSRRVMLSLAGAALALSVVASPVAAGQPSQSCQAPGSLTPPGFLTGGFTNAGSVYAGNGAPSLNSGNSHVVSQYDVACYQLTLHQ
jgi:hypothetical protein